MRRWMFAHRCKPSTLPQHLDGKWANIYPDWPHAALPIVDNVHHRRITMLALRPWPRRRPAAFSLPFGSHIHGQGLDPPAPVGVMIMIMIISHAAAGPPDRPSRTSRSTEYFYNDDDQRRSENEAWTLWLMLCCTALAFTAVIVRRLNELTLRSGIIVPFGSHRTCLIPGVATWPVDWGA